MIHNWKLGIKLLRYAHGIKMTLIIGIAILLLNIPVIIAGILSDNLIMGGYMLMSVSMLPTQLLYSLSASNMVLTTAYRKKLQTSVPAALTCGNMMLMYLISALLYGIVALGQGKLLDNAGEQMLMIALMMDLVMAYTGIAYKYFAAATLCLCLSLPFMLTTALPATGGLGNLFGQGGFSFVSAVLIGLVMLVAGGLLQYLLSRLCYRTPLSKMAQAAPLRKEL